MDDVRPHGPVHDLIALLRQGRRAERALFRIYGGAAEVRERFDELMTIASSQLSVGEYADVVAAVAAGVDGVHALADLYRDDEWIVSWCHYMATTLAAMHELPPASLATWLLLPPPVVDVVSADYTPSTLPPAPSPLSTLTTAAIRRHGPPALAVPSSPRRSLAA